MSFHHNFFYGRQVTYKAILYKFSLTTFHTWNQYQRMLFTGKYLPLFTLLLTWLIYNQGQTSKAESISTGLSFTKENPTSLLPLVPKRLTPTGLTGIVNPLKCARRSLLAFPESRGFLYNSVTGLCTPLLWLEDPSAPGALFLQPYEGDQYLSSGVCGGQFLIMEVGDTGELVCLKYVNTTKVNQRAASSHCAALGAYLVAVKTLAKLKLLQGIVTDDIWVGFEYLRSSGVHIWHKDGEILTPQQYLEVFAPGEPNGRFFKEDCGQFDVRHGFLALNDDQCNRRSHYICEKDLPSLTG